jgi:DNA uptake protein ComE-like DNA-binding protein
MKKILFLSLVIVFTFAITAIIAADFEPININKASEKEMSKLPGISKVSAKRIIAHREELGGLKSIDDLKDITHVTGSGNEVSTFTLKSGKWKTGIRSLVEANLLTVEGGTDVVVEENIYKAMHPNPVDLNTGTLKELMALTGISKVSANRILVHRKHKGGLESLDCLKEITHVTGSGNKVNSFTTKTGKWSAGIGRLINAERVFVGDDYDESIDEDVVVPDDYGDEEE